MLKTKIVSSQEKVFLDDPIDRFPALTQISALRGEVLSVQFLFVDEGDPALPWRPLCDVTVSGALASACTLRDVRWVPVDRPVKPEEYDDQYLRTTPGLYPDVLTPLRYGGKIALSRNKLRSMWVELRIPEDAEGDHPLHITLSLPNGESTSTQSVCIHVIPIALPEQTTHFTQWFYCDCLATYYNVEPFCDRHFEIIESFARAAARRGRDTLYTPLFTPALNVLPGYERLPSQLIRVRLTEGQYSFDFSLVDRWVDMCDRIGIRYLEISHFYQQDNAQHAAHVYATVDGEYKRLFGWETLALDKEYQRFLRAMIAAFIQHMKARGDDGRCLYHISDEPYLAHLEHYRAVKEAIADLLEGYTIIDALSDFDFYSTGVLTHPVPTTASAPAFLEAGAKDLWVYYACCQLIGYSNCYVAMPSYRTRSLAFQLYKFRIAGFLHWGYNYYNNRASGDAINPYMDLGGEDWVPAGDTFMVYPASDGTPLESIRMMTMEEVMQDLRAMQLCETYYSHDKVVAAIEDVLGAPITFDHCAQTAEQLLAVRETINRMIEQAQTA